MGEGKGAMGAFSERQVVRAYAYKLFGTLFAEPLSAETAQLAASADTVEVLSSATGGDTLASYRAWAASWDALDAAGQRAWLIEQEGVYNRLFVGPGRLVAPPWESVYLS